MGYDEHEMLIEYSEMTAFNFNSKEYQEVKRDYERCRSIIDSFASTLKNLLNMFKLARV